MDNPELIEKAERELVDLISRMQRDGIRYDVICWLLTEKKKDLEVIGHASDFLKEYADLPPPMD